MTPFLVGFPFTILEHLDVMAEVDVGQVLDDHVESFAAKEFDHLLLIVLVIVIEHMMGSTTKIMHSIRRNLLKLKVLVT